MDVRPSTRRSYEGLLRLHVIPRIGEVPLQALTREVIKWVYGELTDEGSLSPSSVHRVHSALHRALEDAVSDRLLARNPADSAHSAPKAADRAEMRTWTDSQVRDFFSYAAEDRLFALWRMALFTGARRGELIGLRWDDVDLGAGLVTFNRSRSRQGAKVGVGAPKTGRGRRTVDIDQATASALQQWSVIQLEERLAWGDAYQETDLVFTRENGLPLDPDGTSSRWNRLVRSSGLPRIRFHDSRHTHATLLLKTGVPPHVVSQRLGHSSVAFTMQQYAHVLPMQQQEAVSRLAALIDARFQGEHRGQPIQDR